MITVIFHKSLHKFTNISQHTFEVESISSLVQGMLSLFPKLKAEVQKSLPRNNIAILNSKKELLKQAEILKDELNDELYYIVPIIAGGGDNAGMIIAGIALIAFAYFALPALIGAGTIGAGFGAFATKVLIGVGINLALGGLMAMLNPQPKANQTVDAQERRDNDIFSGLQNSTTSNDMIQEIFGRCRIAGQFVSGSIKTINHAKNDIIRVAENI